MARVLWLRYRPEHHVKLLAWPILCVFPDYMQWWSQSSRRSSDFARLWVMTLSRTSRVWLATLCVSNVHRVRRQPLVRWPGHGATRSRSTLSRYGQRTSDWWPTGNPEIPSGRQPKLQCGEMELKLCDKPRQLYDFIFVTFMDIYRVWSGVSLGFQEWAGPYSGLENCVTDVFWWCGLPLAGRGKCAGPYSGFEYIRCWRKFRMWSVSCRARHSGACRLSRTLQWTCVKTLSTFL